jgi:hypothetical protein
MRASTAGFTVRRPSFAELLLVVEDRADYAQNVRNEGRAKADVFDYIERFYNPKRRHSTIGYLSLGSSSGRPD